MNLIEKILIFESPECSEWKFNSFQGGENPLEEGKGCCKMLSSWLSMESSFMDIQQLWLSDKGLCTDGVISPGLTLTRELVAMDGCSGGRINPY